MDASRWLQLEYDCMQWSRIDYLASERNIKIESSIIPPSNLETSQWVSCHFHSCKSNFALFTSCSQENLVLKSTAGLLS